MPRRPESVRSNDQPDIPRATHPAKGLSPSPSVHERVPPRSGRPLQRVCAFKSHGELDSDIQIQSLPPIWTESPLAQVRGLVQATDAALAGRGREKPAHAGIGGGEEEQ